jgi:iron complex outermembrane receptor protein
MSSNSSPRSPRALRPARAGAIVLLAALPLIAADDSATSTPDNSSPDKVLVLDKFNVTGGFSGSLAAAAEVKQQMPLIAEVIVAEDIGKLPDISIADSLTRITGLAAQRTNGRNQQISIRGLNGDFATAMLNGREQVSTNDNRSVEFDQYPAELLNKVVIYKTATPSLVGQGLAGTVDMRTVEPLSKTGRSVVINGYYQWTEYGALTPGAKGSGERATFSYIDQFDDGKVGIALGVAYSSTPWAGKQFQAWGYPNYTDGSYTMGGTKSYVRTSDLDRTGYMGVIEFQPNDSIHSIVDLYYSKFEERQILRGIEIPMAVWGDAAVQPGFTVNDGLMTNYTLTGVHPVVRNDTFKRNDEPFSIGWNLQMGRKSDWPVTFDAAYSRVSRTDVNIETWSGLSFNKNPTGPSDTLTVKLTPGQIPVIKSALDYADGSVLQVTDPQGWQTWYAPIASTSSPGYVKNLKAKDELGQFKLSTEHELKNVFAKIETGVSYTDRYKRAGEGPTGFPVNANNQPTAPLPPKIGTTDMSFLGLGDIYAYDPLAAFEGGAFNFVPNTNFDYVALRFDVEEKVAQYYLQGDIDTKIGGIPVTGDIGFRVINVDQSSKGFSRNGSTNQLNQVSDGDKYTDFAPSMNLNFLVAPRTFLRFSAARQLARPRMIDMRAGQAYGFDPTRVSSTDLSQSPWSGSGGNARLRPWKADALDLSLEKYFTENRGYIAIAGFYKKLVSYIYAQSVLADFTGYPTGGLDPALNQGAVTAPQNGKNGSIKGLEFTWSLPSELINRDIRGFGLVLNGAYTESDVEPWGPGNGTAPIAGLSRKVANITLYYENRGFSARVSNRYRSENRQYITTFGAPNPTGDSSPGSGFTLAQPESIIDAQISYTFQSGRAKGLTLYLQGYNLNDEPLITYNDGDPRQVMNYQKYGASYSVGASFKF